MPEPIEQMAITPDTKVGPLLASYPQLEDVLIEISPTYRALKNPVLRKTVAKIATLRQVAKVGNVAIGTLVNQLRAAVGQPVTDAVEDSATASARPDWAHDGQVTQRFDARDLIESGGHPLERVMRDLDRLASGGVYLLITPFVPAPMIELVEKKGFVVFSRWFGPAVVHSYFRRR